MIHHTKLNQALQQQVNNLERINMDLEKRLERQAKERMEVEHECAEIDRRWRERYGKLEKTIDQYKLQIHKHQQQYDRLVRADQCGTPPSIIIRIS